MLLKDVDPVLFPNQHSLNPGFLKALWNFSDFDLSLQDTKETKDKSSLQCDFWCDGDFAKFCSSHLGCSLGCKPFPWVTDMRTYQFRINLSEIVERILEQRNTSGLSTLSLQWKAAILFQNTWPACLGTSSSFRRGITSPLFRRSIGISTYQVHTAGIWFWGV